MLSITSLRFTVLTGIQLSKKYNQLCFKLETIEERHGQESSKKRVYLRIKRILGAARHSFDRLREKLLLYDNLTFAHI